MVTAGDGHGDGNGDGDGDGESPLADVSVDWYILL